jgi:hypothetical protein
MWRPIGLEHPAAVETKVHESRGEMRCSAGSRQDVLLEPKDCRLAEFLRIQLRTCD